MAEKAAKSIVRVSETNLDGTQKVSRAIRKVRGVSFMLANAISEVSGMGERVLGELSDGEIKNLEDFIANPQKHGVPSWMFNRRSDPESGSDMHLSVSRLDLTKKLDINLMKKMKSYKGVRHSYGLPVRGQRTRGSFRKGRAMGVSRAKQMPGKRE